MIKVAATLAVLALSVACGGDDEKLPDARVVDAQVVDAVVVDGPAPDAAELDGPALDGPASDALPPDALAIDALPPDAPAATVNGCTLAAATDLSAAGTPTVAFGDLIGFAYSPRCARITPGQAVTFSGTFASHPLVAGIVVGGVPTAQPGGPIATTSTGTTAVFTFPTAGVFPYYCQFHGGGTMNGVVYVQ